MTLSGLRDALRKGLLMDSNVLFLYLFGIYDLSNIGRVKPLSGYNENDFYLMHSLVENTNAVYCLPNIVTEVGNLSNKLHSGMKKGFLERIKDDVKGMIERYIPSSQIVDWSAFSTFGVADSAIAMFARNQECLVVTNDLPLYGVLCNEGMAAVHVQQLRSFM